MALHPQALAAIALWAEETSCSAPGFGPAEIAAHRDRARAEAAAEPREEVAAVREIDADGVPCRLYAPPSAATGTGAARSSSRTAAASSSARSPPTTRARAGSPTAPVGRCSRSTTGSRPSTASRPHPTTCRQQAAGWPSTPPGWASTRAAWSASATARGQPRARGRPARSRTVRRLRARLPLHRPAAPQCVVPGRGRPRVQRRGGGLVLAHLRGRRRPGRRPAGRRCVLPARRTRAGGLPPTQVLVAEHDILRDEDLLLADRIAAAGGLVETVLYPGMIHGFWGNTALFDAAEESYADTAAFLGRVLGLPST
ncbi:MAG: alpha/beta hydrolase fold domain-containing protein [Nocardioides sp.]